MSDAQKLGRAEIESINLKASNEALKNELSIKDRPAGSDNDIVDRL